VAANRQLPDRNRTGPRRQHPQPNSTSAHGVADALPVGTSLGAIVSKYVLAMKTRRTRHGFTADLSYLRGISVPVLAEVGTARERTRDEGMSNVVKSFASSH